MVLVLKGSDSEFCLHVRDFGKSLFNGEDPRAPSETHPVVMMCRLTLQRSCTGIEHSCTRKVVEWRHCLDSIGVLRSQCWLIRWESMIFDLGKHEMHGNRAYTGGSRASIGGDRAGIEPAPAVIEPAPAMTEVPTLMPYSPRRFPRSRTTSARNGLLCHWSLIWRFQLEHQQVLEIYHYDDAEPKQTDAQRVLGDGCIGVWITNVLAISRLSVRIDLDWWQWAL